MRLIWSAPALDDLRRINDYLEGFDIRAVIAALNAINSKAKLLRSFPALGPPVDPTRRYVSVSRTPYIIVYAMYLDRVEIGRVYDSRQDWQRQLEE